MHLTLLDADDHVVIWVDGQQVMPGENVDVAFGRLSRTLETARRDREAITAWWETEFESAPGKKRFYRNPSSENVERSRVQLAYFGGELKKPNPVAEVPN